MFRDIHVDLRDGVLHGDVDDRGDFHGQCGHFGQYVLDGLWFREPLQLLVRHLRRQFRQVQHHHLRLGADDAGDVNLHSLLKILRYRLIHLNWWSLLDLYVDPVRRDDDGVRHANSHHRASRLKVPCESLPLFTLFARQFFLYILVILAVLAGRLISFLPFESGFSDLSGLASDLTSGGAWKIGDATTAGTAFLRVFFSVGASDTS
jgi:hypothetical protein